MTNSHPTLPTIAVVIPTLNEEAALGAALTAARPQLVDGVRLVVADGGSRDRTVAIAEQFGARVVQTAEPGRGWQIAAAVEELIEDAVLVLHADAVLPPRSIERVRRWLADHPLCPGGCLGHRFDSPRVVYRIIEGWDALRARWGVSFGDQAQFFRREWLARRGGFPRQPILEDFELSHRLAALGRPAYLSCPVTVSPRRFERLGWRRAAFTNLLLRMSYRVGGPAAACRLYRRYYDCSGD